MPKKQEVCPYYERGFCKLAGDCLFYNDATNQNLCRDYLLGFCPLGPKCDKYHMKGMLSPEDLNTMVIANMPEKYKWPPGPPPNMNNMRGMMNQQKITCHKCGVEGHKSTYCQEEKLRDSDMARLMANNQQFNVVTCFSCFQKGHYANVCPLKIAR